MTYDEGPSQEDIDRFSHNETGYCPNCSEEIWDDTNKCPSCGAWLTEGALHQTPTTRAFNKKFLIIIVMVILLGFFWGLKRFF
jgi:predicted amidophosphoribosyltransferase